MRSIVRFACFIATALTTFHATAQNLWTESTDKHQDYFKSRNAVARPSAYKLMNLNTAKLKQIQAAVPFMSDNTAQIAGAPFEVPMPDGSLRRTTLVETSLWADRNFANSIGVKTYSMFNPDTKAFEGNLTMWDGNIRGVSYTDKGSYYITPLNNDQSGEHMVYYLKDDNVSDVTCGVEGTVNNNPVRSVRRTEAGTCVPKTFRIMLSATGEYTAWAGSVSQAQVYMTATMNTVAGIYRRDLNVFFSLLSNTSFVYTDASTDPYSTGGTVDGTLLNQNRDDLLNKLGSAGYDLGIVFTRMSSGGGSGLAALGVVCDNANKGRAAIGHNNPLNSWFDGATAHELGHNFGAHHAFSATNNACQSNRTISTSWEPGSGSTLMSYGAAACGVTNSVVNNQDMYFHAGSIQEMQNYISSGGTCYSSGTSSNVAPTATVAGNSYNIPANTPFVLTLNSTDANGDALTYTWEQMDPTTASSVLTSPTGSETDGPLFRSYFPSSNPTRYFPSLTYLSSGTTYAYEVLPTVARTLNFRGTVRDGSLASGGCTNEQNVTLNVKSSTGLVVTQPAWGTVWTKVGNNTAPVSWDVAGTASAPISCSQVDIFLSTDGGLSFPITLATAVPNTGTANVPIPAVNTNTARVMVKGRNNVFFNINADNFIVADPMPVTFLSFTARKEGNSAVLGWSTATESNSDKFIVERAANTTDFKTEIGTVKAAGNSTMVKNYSLTDAFPLNKWNYYRVKEVDVDGKVLYSNVASVYFDKEKGSVISVYPNPVKDITSIDFFAERAGKVKMEVYDSKGALVSSSTYIAVTGFNRTTVNLQSLSTGIYTLKCYTEGEQIGVMKLIKN